MRQVTGVFFIATLIAGLTLPARAQEEVFPPPPDQEIIEEGTQFVPTPRKGKKDTVNGEAKPETAPSTVKPEPPVVSAPSPRNNNLRSKKPGRIPPELAKITVRLSDVPLPVFLKAISQQTHVNFILSEGLETKKMTAFLEEVTLEEALNVFLGIKGLTYEKIPGKSHTYLISTRKDTGPRTITRIFELNYIPLQDIKIEALQSEDQSSSQLGQIPSLGASDAGGLSSEAQGGGTQDNKGIIAILRLLLSSSGRIAVDERTNSLIVTDIPERFPQIETVIRELDRKSPQVTIESQIVEINSNGLDQLGFQFGGANGELARFIGPSRFTEAGLATGGPEGGRLFPHVPLAGEITGAAFSPSGGAAVGAYDSRYGLSLGVLSLNELQILLQAIVTKSRGKILSRPRITTLNNKPAEIRLSRNQAIGTGQATSGLTGGTIGTSVERQQTGIVLRVTPQVNGDGYITMVVEPKVSRVENSAVGATIKDPVTKAIKTMIRVRNGETVVLGGLMDTEEQKVVRKVPLLGDIPIIGWIFFRSYRTEQRNLELAVFLTPTILDL